MTIGIINTGVSAQRKTADHRSEMINQLLFGEIVFVGEEKGEWSEVVSYPDQYQGFILSTHLRKLSAEKPEEVLKCNTHISSDWVSVVSGKEPLSTMLIPPGSRLYNINDAHFELEEWQGNITGKLLEQQRGYAAESLIANAFRFLNTPYLWGGKTPFGMDCSGFIQVVFRMSGIELPRDAWQQAEKGSGVDFVEECQPGDLAFFGEENESINHVGLILTSNTIIHCSGKVKVDSFDHNGIFANKTYSHKLRLIKRIKS
jgi:hypothetical protein